MSPNAGGGDFVDVVALNADRKSVVLHKMKSLSQRSKLTAKHTMMEGRIDDAVTE